MAAEQMIDGGAEVTEPYGCGGAYQPCPCQFNPGIDLAAPCGATIRAVGYGQVMTVGVPCWAGPHAVIVRTGPYDLLWAHCSNHFVSSGDWVGPRQAIAAIGSMTGCPSCGAHQSNPCAASNNCGGVATGPHTHFQVHEAGQPFDSLYCDGVDPDPFLTSWPGTAPNQPPPGPPPPGPPPALIVGGSAAVPLLLAGAGVVLLLAGQKPR